MRSEKVVAAKPWFGKNCVCAMTGMVVSPDSKTVVRLMTAWFVGTASQLNPPLYDTSTLYFIASKNQMS